VSGLKEHSTMTLDKPRLVGGLLAVGAALVVFGLSGYQAPRFPRFEQPARLEMAIGVGLVATGLYLSRQD